MSDVGELVFLDTVHSEISVVNDGAKPWTINIQLNGDILEFKIDTGADVTVIPATIYKESRDTSLQPAGKVLRGPSQHTLSVLVRVPSSPPIRRLKKQFMWYRDYINHY